MYSLKQAKSSSALSGTATGASMSFPGSVVSYLTLAFDCVLETMSIQPNLFNVQSYLRCPGTAWLKHISFSQLRFPRAITCAQPEIPDPSPLSRLYSKFQAQCPDNEYPYIRAINICYKLNRMRKGSTQGARGDRHNM